MSELYELPEGWEWKNINSIIKNKADFTDGNWVLAKDYDLPKEVRLLQLADVGEGYFIDKSDKWVSKNKSIELKGKYINTGDILISRLGEILAKSCIVPKLNYKTMTSVDIAILRMNEELFHNKYIMLYFNSNIAKDFVNKEATGATRKRISRKNLGQIPLPIPEISEQKRIVAKLDALFEKIDRAIALHQKNMDEADAFMGSVLNDVFGELEEKYEKIKLSKIVKIIGGGTPSKKEKSYWDNGTIKWATVGDMNVDVIENTELSITEFGLKNSSSNIVPKEAIIIATRVGLGKVCYLQDDIAINQDLKGLIPLNDEINMRFLYNYFKNITEYIVSNGTGATVKGVKLEFIKELLLPLPPLKTQQKTVNYLDKISLHVKRVKEVQKEKMEHLKALKASILDQAFRGQL